jgi:hypothetical protein
VADEGAPADEPAVVFIGGFGRSGSTLLECLLARLDDVVVLGEVEHLWHRGVLENQRCACGQPFHECPFWTEVGARAFGGWERSHAERVLELKAAVVRQRRLLGSARRRPPAGYREPLQEYAAQHHAIYRAARDLSGASVVVDSSKFPPMAVALAHDASLDLRVLQIVRDIRGVAYSWSKTVARPETETGQPMPRYSPAYSSVSWLSHNLALDAVRWLGRPVVRIRYEDLVDDAGDTVADAWRELGLPGEGRLPMVDRRTIELVPSHSVAGNPMRFRTGTTVLRADDEWQRRMPARDRRVVTALTAPLLARMGYRLRG